MPAGQRQYMQAGFTQDIVNPRARCAPDLEGPNERLFPPAIRRALAESRFEPARAITGSKGRNRPARMNASKVGRESLIFSSMKRYRRVSVPGGIGIPPDDLLPFANS